MNEPMLDRLSREHGEDVRRHIANMIVVGNASRADVCESLARKYSIPAPSTRSVSNWTKKDVKLRAMIEELKAIKQTAPGGDPSDLLPRQVDTAKVDEDLFAEVEQHPAWAELWFRGGTTADQPAPETDYYGNVVNGPDTPDAEPAERDDAMAVLLAGHTTHEAFEADAISRLTDAERASIAHLLPVA